MKKRPFVFTIFLCLTHGFLVAAEPASPSVSKNEAQMIFTGARGSVKLSGTWEALPIEGIDFHYPPPAQGWKTEKIPMHDSPLLDGNPYDRGVPEFIDKEGHFKKKTGMAAWLKREFKSPPPLDPDQRALLVFKGMSYKSRVWLNGREIGGSINGYVPVAYDVTGMLKPGAMNELVVGLATREALIDIENRTFITATRGASAGIWDDVELQVVPAVRIDDAFIKTSVKNKRVDVDVTVVNDGTSPRTLTLDGVIEDSHGQLQTSLPPTPITVNSGTSSTVTISVNWIAPQLWAPKTPALYFTRIQLHNGEKLVDSKTDRFGYREFEIRGRDFYLNGVRITLLRNSHLQVLGSHTTVDTFVCQQGYPCNSIRLHCGFNNIELLDLCDELGILTMPEAGWLTLDDNHVVEKRNLWLPNVEKYIQSVIRLHRNRPSVVLWNLTNETCWDNTDPARMEIADGVLAAARAADPTRPFEADADNTWGGRLPIISIHYPEGNIGNSLQAKYPNSSYVFPNDWHWLKKEGENTSWRGRFVWDRPLIIGEYAVGWAGVAADNLSSYMGESNYDWEKWRYQSAAGVEGPTDDNEYVKALQGVTDACRIDGVAGLNPWGGNLAQIMPKIAVRPVDFFPNLFGAKTSVRKFVVFNDTQESFNYPTLQCRMTVNGKTIWDKRIPVSIGPGEIKPVDIPIDVPQVTTVTPAELTVNFLSHWAGGYHSRSFYKETVFLVPPGTLKNIDKSKVVLLDASGKTAAAIKQLGADIPALKILTDADLKKAKLLVVGERTDPNPFRDTINAFAQNGGAVLVLQQDGTKSIAGELPESDPVHISTRSWKRTFDSPITRDLDDRQFSYWRPDHLVSYKTFRKPSGGPVRSLLDAGGLYGMVWSPLVELSEGKGVFLACQLNLAGRVSEEPMAGLLLSRLMNYGFQYKAAPTPSLRLLAGTNASVRNALSSAGVVFTEGLNGKGPVLLDASFSPAKPQIDTLKHYLQGGGHLWLHGFGKDNSVPIADLFPFKPEFVAYDQTVQAAVRRSDDPLMSGLSSFDFFWSKQGGESRLDIFEKAKATAKLGGEVLHAPDLNSAQALTEPALMTKVPVGKGTILVDNILWEQALGAELEKVNRIVASLALNQGAQVRLPGADEPDYDYFNIDLSKQANAGYYNKATGKVPGWTADGENDMRFFLINHTGKLGGVEAGMEEPTEAFPSKITFVRRPFALTDPKKNEGKGVISLRGKGHGEQLPEAANGIPVGHKADKLWFLHSEGWVSASQQEFARAVIHYEDGGTETFPFRYGIEGSDWWAPATLSNAKVAWTGRNLVHSPVGIYLSEWTNPRPNEKIKSIDFIGNLSPTQTVLLGITGGTTKGSGKPAAHPISLWNLEGSSDSKIMNAVHDGAPLNLGKPAPEPATLENMPCFRFQNGAFLQGDYQSMPEMGKGGPFTFEISMAVASYSTRPGGDGIVQAGYGSGGFRMYLSNEGRLGVALFTTQGPKYLTGKTPLEKGRFYSVKIVFAEDHATLFVDGKPDAVITSTPPAAQTSGITIGTGSGIGNFDGWIRKIEFQSSR